GLQHNGKLLGKVRVVRRNTGRKGTAMNDGFEPEIEILEESEERKEPTYVVARKPLLIGGKTFITGQVITEEMPESILRYHLMCGHIREI
ncbi:MAG: hypothetical protein V1792_28680, partial [Pseudomonadota bacterium]